MPPRASSRATSKPVSQAAKPPSKAAKPPSTKPASRRGPAAAGPPPAPPAPEPIQENEDIDMAESSAPPAPVIAEPSKADIEMEEAPKVNGSIPEKAVPAKRGRVGALVEAEKKTRRRSSLGIVMNLAIPQIPELSDPHKALFIFGTGDMGQFGLGPDELDEIPRPKLHSWLEEQIEDGKLSRDGKEGSGGLETIACGGMHTLAIDEAGRVRSWGINDNAALGRPTSNVPDPKNPDSMIPNEDLETYPYVVEALEKEGFRAVHVAAGDSVSVAISDKGELRAWGSFRSNDGLLGFDGFPGHDRLQFTPIALPRLDKIKIVSVSCGSDHVLALANTGHVYVWGNGQQNQLGRRIIERRKINGLEPERLGLRNIVYISAGKYHSFAINSEGTVWAWGLNGNRQCGISPHRPDHDSEQITVPIQVDGLSPEDHDGAKVVSIAGGEHYSIFLFDNGEVWGCGRNDAHELGLADDHPAQEGVKERSEEMLKEKQEKVSMKQKKLEEVRNADEVVREKAELELAEAQASLRVPMVEYVPEPVRIFFPPVPVSYEVVPDMTPSSQPSDNPIAVISAGTRHNLAVSRSGHVYSWGLGNQAQLGLGADTESAEVPTLVRSKMLRPYKAVFASAGGQHCVVLAQKAE